MDRRSDLVPSGEYFQEAEAADALGRTHGDHHAMAVCIVNVPQERLRSHDIDYSLLSVLRHNYGTSALDLRT